MPNNVFTFYFIKEEVTTEMPRTTDKLATTTINETTKIATIGNV